MTTKIEIAVIIVMIIIIGFVAPILKSTTFICAVPDIPINETPRCPGYCDNMCGRNTSECQSQVCNDLKCTISWYWMCVLK
jgi:hypothetical protein